MQQAKCIECRLCNIVGIRIPRVPLEHEAVISLAKRQLGSTVELFVQIGYRPVGQPARWRNTVVSADQVNCLCDEACANLRVAGRGSGVRSAPFRYKNISAEVDLLDRAYHLLVEAAGWNRKRNGCIVGLTVGVICDEVELAIVLPAVFDQIGDADGRASAGLCRPAHFDVRVAAHQALHRVVVQFVVAGHSKGVHPGRFIPDLEVPVLSHLFDAVALLQVLHQGRHEIHPAVPILGRTDVGRRMVVPM